MYRRIRALIPLVFVLGLVLASVSDAALVGWWKFNDGSGTVAKDSSGRGYDGTVINPVWAEGKYGGALSFGGTSYVDVPPASWSTIKTQATVCFWAYGDPVQQPQANFIFGAFSDPANNEARKMSAHVPWSDGTIYFDTGGPTYDRINRAGSVSDYEGTWTFWTFLKNADTGAQQIYINGVLWHSGTGMTKTMEGVTKFTIGTKPSLLEGWYRGMIDDFRLYDTALSVDEIQEAMTGRGPGLGLASDPVPASETTDIPRDAMLSWTTGQYPSTHDVYVGTTFADVNSASRTNAKGVLASQGQADTTFDPPGSLAYGQTYYWRIDEVNKSADGTIYKGEAWSFTVEPYGYPITSITATASSSAASMGPEKTIDGSGLTGDLHGTEGTTMWLTGGAAPNWIQYQFDKVYKLNDLKVWNSNQLIEGFLGFGAKKVTIETSADGTTWAALANVPEFGRATAMPGYAANTTVNLGGVMAQYVKLTINANWGGMAPQAGLSEVRFSYVPVQARAPQPATAATGVAVDPSLNWRPGREAGSHAVVFGADPNAVANGTVAAKTVADHAFAPGSLNFGTAYYWKVDEVNTVTYPGDVWSFTTQEFAAIDDFESYNDEDKRIYDAWIDGYTDGKSGSIVGNMQAPFAEQTIIHAGKQAMPFEYNNVKAPYYSEASRTFEATQNWTTNGADTVSLYFRGRAAGFADNGNNAFTMSSSGTDVWGTSDQFRFAYKSLNGDGSIVARVDSIVNTNVWAKGGVMIRQSIEAGSTHAFMPITPGGSGAGNGASFQRRLTAGGTSTNSDNTGAVVAAPYWVKVERKGNSFTGSISPDGKTWTALGTPQTITMTNPVLIGLAVSSHDAARTTVAEISNVSTTGTVTGSWQAVAIGMAMPTNGAAPLYLTVEDKAGKTKTVVNPNPSASATGAWTQWKIPLSDLTGVSLTTVQKITLGVGDKASPKAGAAGMLYFDDIGYGHPAQ